MRILRVVEIVCACLLLLMVTANAFGVNPIKAFFQWADEVVQVYTNPSGLMELPEGNTSEYRTLEEALAANGAETGNCPNWVPNDCNLTQVYVRRNDSAIKYSAVYTSDRGEFSIRVIQYLDDSARIAERENDGNAYFHGGREFYIVPNYESGSAGWENGLYSYEISGQISEAELKTMIDSIE